MTDFFTKAGPSDAKKKPVPRKISQKMKPASPPKPKKVAAKKVVDSEDDDDDLMDYDELPKAPPVRARAARAAPKTYIEVISDEEPGDAGDSLFESDD